jgi:hypothetical protein
LFPVIIHTFSPAKKVGKKLQHACMMPGVDKFQPSWQYVRKKTGAMKRE